MHDKFKKRRQVSRVDTRLRKQIAQEAARRLIGGRNAQGGPAAAADMLWLDETDEAAFHAAKRKAVTVLGHRVRPTDLPTDDEVRAQVVARLRAGGDDADDEPEPEASTIAGGIAAHLDRFTLYKLRLLPLEAVKQNPKRHPEGDALYHSLQVFDRAKEATPFDEEFLLAALLHDVGKAIDPQNHVAAAVEALRGAVPERTLWLIENYKSASHPRDKRSIETESAELKADLELLRELDEAGRVPGMPVGTVDEALAYLQGLESEEFLEE